MSFLSGCRLTQHGTHGRIQCTVQNVTPSSIVRIEHQRIGLATSIFLDAHPSAVGKAVRRVIAAGIVDESAFQSEASRFHVLSRSFGSSCVAPSRSCMAQHAHQKGMSSDVAHCTESVKTRARKTRGNSRLQARSAGVLRSGGAITINVEVGERQTFRASTMIAAGVGGSGSILTGFWRGDRTANERPILRTRRALGTGNVRLLGTKPGPDKARSGQSQGTSNLFAL